MTTYPRTVCIPVLLSLYLFYGGARSEAQQGLVEGIGSSSLEKEDGWVINSDRQTGLMIRTKELTLHPKEEPRPALKYRFLPDEFNATRGNAAIYYLKAMGFVGESTARNRLTAYHEQAAAKARMEGNYDDFPPYVWLKTAPSDLPVDKVKEYLRLTSFQRPLIRAGARCDRFDMDRNIRDVADPISYLLPEIQRMRELARNQSVRCRLAIAEGRIDDAIEITGQQFALARHLAQDDFLISNLVGIAVAGIAWNDVLYLVQHPETPNLYWALAAMPRPLAPFRRSLATERQFFYLQLKVLREVDETPRPAGYWQDFLDRLPEQFGGLASEFGIPFMEDDPESSRAALVGFVAAAYPGARDYLLTQCKLPEQQINAYPTAQVVFLAMVRYYDHWRDEHFKWMHLPFWQARTKGDPAEVDSAMKAQSDRYGWCALPTQLLLPAIRAAQAAEARCDQTIALIQTVEAVRMYAASHQGKLPPSLNAMRVPAPIEPFTGKPIDYEFRGTHAVVTGHALPGMRYRLVLRVADSSK